ncbi:acyltransferase family protein [Demequina sp. SYSU T00192]|uniref:Acyltransferase family protein n=1 Tax=Demequina litoralis TaxID=3051660 RepID=A0ABT8G8M7_9MICO|nr:acyltransferase family protein [Demequina sp. SYSU T00192]MDN4475422.1 acyltransferase family protein [Demequina sp. SYSU T00192]
MTAMGERNAGIDLVRVLGIMAIVAGHCIPLGSWTSALFIWHVPVFFFLTGYLWKPQRAIRDEAARRTRTLLKPYLFWFSATYALFLAGATLSGHSPDLLLAPVYGGYYAVRPFTTFWFVFALFGTALLWRVLELAPQWARGIFVVAALLVAPFVGAPLSQTPLALGTSLLAVVFVALGQVTRAYEPRIGSARAWLGAGMFVTGVALTMLDAV